MRRAAFPKIFLLSLLACLHFSCAAFQRHPGDSRNRRSSDFSMAPLRDASVSKYVNDVAGNLTARTIPDEPAFPAVEVDVLKTSRIQGASVFDEPSIHITRGMLNVLMNEAELACLIGHEIGHKVLHSKNRRYKKNQSWSGIFIPDDMAEAKWSQKREEEADEYGAGLCHKAGYNAHAFLGFMERMAQFQRSNFWTALDELTATHKDFKSRAKHLRRFLETSGIPPEAGLLRQTEYVHALASLGDVRSGDAVNELLPGGAGHAIHQLNAVEQELEEHLKNNRPLSAVRFIAIMEDISKISRQYGLSGAKGRSSPAPFMKEVLSQDSPLWDSEALRKKVEEVLHLSGRIGIGFIPVAGDAVDLYEFLAGKEFGTNDSLSVNERIITAAGLLAGSGMAWRKTAHGVEQTLKDTGLVGKVGRRSIADANYALREGGNLVEAGKQNKLIVIGYFPRYLQKAEELGARRSNIPQNVWNKMTLSEQWEANKKFLDRAIHRGDEIILANPVKKIGDTTGTFRKELEYLTEHGFKLSKNGAKMEKI